MHRKLLMEDRRRLFPPCPGPHLPAMPGLEGREGEEEELEDCLLGQWR